MRACGSSFSFLSIMVCATALYGMVWPAILMEWSVEEDSSLGGGGVGSAGFSFSKVLVSFSCACRARGVSASSSVPAIAARFILRIIGTPRRWIQNVLRNNNGSEKAQESVHAH